MTNKRWQHLQGFNKYKTNCYHLYKQQVTQYLLQTLNSVTTLRFAMPNTLTSPLNRFNIHCYKTHWYTFPLHPLLCQTYRVNTCSAFIFPVLIQHYYNLLLLLYIHSYNLKSNCTSALLRPLLNLPYITAHLPPHPPSCTPCHTQNLSSSPLHTSLHYSSTLSSNTYSFPLPYTWPLHLLTAQTFTIPPQSSYIHTSFLTLTAVL